METMDRTSNNDHQIEMQEVTVEVLPDTVTEIIYLPDGDLSNNDSTYYEDDLDCEEPTEYEIGCVDTTKLPNSDLVLDQTETFVLLPAQTNFLNSGAIFLHKSTDEENEEDMYLGEQFDCIKCNYKTNSFESLQSHLFTHNIEQSCNICGKIFSKAYLLTKHHKREHLTTNKANVQGARRKVHSVKHQEEKKYVCHTCNENFENDENLMKHMETHGNILLYACNKCDAAFSSTREVSIHLRVAHSRAKHKTTIKDPEYKPTASLKPR